MAKRRPRKTPRLRTLVDVTGTGTLIDVTPKSEIDTVIDLMRGAIKMITGTIAIHHAKIERTMTIIKMTSLVVLMTKDSPMRRNQLRTIKVTTMPIMWKQVKTLLAIVPALVALIPPSRKSKGSACNHTRLPSKLPSE